MSKPEENTIGVPIIATLNICPSKMAISLFVLTIVRKAATRWIGKLSLYQWWLKKRQSEQYLRLKCSTK